MMTAIKAAMASRKDIAGLVTFLASTVLLWAGKISSDQWFSLNQVVLPAWFGARTLHDIAKVWQDGKAPPVSNELPAVPNPGADVQPSEATTKS